MSRRARILVAFALVLLSVVGLDAGPGIRACLLPVSARMPSVWCDQLMGVPGVGLGLPVSALALAGAALVVAPVPAGRRRAVLVGAVLGGAIGGAAFLVLRPLTEEGFGSAGTWISIPLPLDTSMLAAAVIFGAVVAAIVVRLVPGARRVGLARS